MKKYKVTICYYGRFEPATGHQEYLKEVVEIESFSPLNAELSAADELGIRQYYAAWVEEVLQLPQFN